MLHNILALTPWLLLSICSAVSWAQITPNIVDIHLSGFGMVRDSVSVSFQAAAKALGKDADYEHLYLLSGNAFAPAIDTSESCRSWWHVEARMGTHNLPAMAASAGLVAQKLALPVLSASSTEEQKKANRQSLSKLVIKALKSGAVVMTEGGWDEAGGWVWSGVVTDVSDEGTIRGSAMSAVTGDGKVNVEWKYPGRLWAIRPGKIVTPARKVDRFILSEGVIRIRGTGYYAAHGADRYGLSAMDQWIASMRDARGFCADCFKRSPVVGVQDAPDNDKRMYEAARIVARQLRTGFSTLPAGAAQHVQKAADCYDRIAVLLEPGATGKGGFTWDSLSSLEAQRGYVEIVLEPVKTELERAAGYLEKALRY